MQGLFMIDSLCTAPNAKGMSFGAAGTRDVAATGARGCLVSNSGVSFRVKIGVPACLVTLSGLCIYTPKSAQYGSPLIAQINQRSQVTIVYFWMCLCKENSGNKTVRMCSLCSSCDYIAIFGRMTSCLYQQLPNMLEHLL